MASIFVVMGTTGEYSDRTEWPVVAYTDKAMAERHDFAAKKRAHAYMAQECEHGEKTTSACDPCKRDYEWGSEAFQKWMGDLDPSGSRPDYTGADYFTMEVPVRDSLPKGADDAA